ncbi:hypothetical protein K1T73_03320 [Roseovarius sp. SCSIO 43702]|uniref:hypothetical protein n=1 Tax=Roseovarius sp. SCSIO 43702 TaxID=2823043 RepID=UPI001C7388EB|nr:hypothetical protein [Roseovarius sp. SCSIO 43702]QYX57445.1 hypothetical protein K1T73_03320 [Roseovarius sp. SCSIO 43702]
MMKYTVLGFALSVLSTAVWSQETDNLKAYLELTDGEFEVVDGKVIATENGFILENAVIRIRHGVLVFGSQPIEASVEDEWDHAAFRKDMGAKLQQCWNVGSLSSDALEVSVSVAFDLAANGQLISNSIRMIDASGGGSGAARQAFEAARRAIIRCAGDGFDLPPEKYGHWKTIEMTFNPEKMRIK